MRKFSFLSIICLTMLACNDNSSSEANVNEESNYASFGVEIDDDNTVDIKSLTEKLEKADSLNVKLAATVDAVCQMKGCWMTIENEYGDPMRVTFKDYGFFVPKDIAGKKAVVQGTVRKVTLSEEDARHFAEDAGTEYDSTKSYTELAFVADGVLIEAGKEPSGKEPSGQEPTD